MEYKIVLCLLLSVVAAYADDKEEKVEAAVSLKDNFTLFSSVKMKIFVITNACGKFFSSFNHLQHSAEGIHSPRIVRFQTFLHYFKLSALNR